jgi:putative PEP-CTERM system histidine kinase
MPITLISHVAAAAAFLLLSVLLLVSGGRSRGTLLLLFASAATAGWAALVAASIDRPGGAPPILLNVAELVRTGAWLVFFGGLLAPTTTFLRAPARQRAAFAGLVLALVAAAASEQLSRAAGAQSAELGMKLEICVRLLLSVVGLLLIENLFRNTSPDGVWAMKFLVFGAGCIFVYDFYLYSDGLLFGHVNAELFDARGAVNALAAPLLAIAASRNRDWAIELHVSRAAVFHTTTVVGSGAYLVAMAGAGYYLRTIGGEWGSLLQALFLTGAALILLIALFSGSARARLRYVISRNFYSYKYDYRHEWRRLIARISAPEGQLQDRAIRAMADILDSPAGALWQYAPNGDAYHPSASWNFPDDLPVLAADHPLARFLAERSWIVELSELAARPDLYPGVVRPDWFDRLPQPWLVAPLAHRQRMEGILVLSRPRANKPLDGEDYELLKIVSRQLASYLAEEAALRRLVDAQQLEQFSKRFAFVIHDIKNITSQLSLMLSNAERHGANPEFQADAMRTVRNAVEKMSKLLGQLRSDRSEPRGSTAALAREPLVRRAVDAWLGGRPTLKLELTAPDATALVDAEGLDRVIAHLVQNAIEAAGPDGQVLLRLSADGHYAILEIIDDGPGMDAAFIRDELFRPLATTKKSGSGLGAYQARELVRGMGGQLEVRSAPGAGATFRVMLRREAAAPARLERSA